MNAGTPAAKEAGNLIDLDPTKLIEVVMVGKELLISRGALTIFSIANDVAKYFAILPAIFVTAQPGLGALNVMRLHSSQSTILSAVIFNARILVALIPLAMTGLMGVLAPGAARGSLIERDGVTVGSALIGQQAEGDQWLRPRRSASAWNAARTGAANFGPTKATLIADLAARRAAWEALNGAPAPINAVTTPGSGLDPDVSPETALARSDRIAKARDAGPAAVPALIAGQLPGRWLGAFGEPRVILLLTNLALDRAFPPPAPLA